MSDAPLAKHYLPAEVERRWTERWLQADCFHADAASPRPPFAITLPPPNVTGSLHMGHALGSTIQDALIRHHRMLGDNAMWMPGKDHAGIATQMLVERDVARREGKTRHDLGRDAFLERVWAWKQRYGDRITEQMKVMGFALDWSRERFTMDEQASRAVREVFVRLHEQGLIYRAHRLVNWCTECFTAISDLEVNNVEESGHLWELKYPIVDGDGAFITVATTRPETMLGDTGVAVHPDDERYQHLHGKRVRLPLCDRDIPIVADTFVEPAFGSGAVKVTPGHDFNDFECGQRCGLEVLSVIDHHGRMIDPAPPRYRGMTVAEARAAVVADLEAQGFLGQVRDYQVARGRCDRSGTVIEPLLSEQWFVRTEPLARPAIEAVERGATVFVPELWTKTYMHWMTNIKDWCISRQLWWGHRIPAWHCADCREIHVARHAPEVCAACGSARLTQDEDVLDTWFSSALWPFSTLGWPDETAALRAFYPNAVMVTGPDIIFFWVARMMMMGLHFMGEVPFRTVYLTPIVTDERGDKMSKVKGNVVDPLDVVNGATLDELLARADDAGAPEDAKATIRKLFAKGITAAGVDALRFSLLAMTLPGRNIRLSMERIEGYRHFINKLWNASRFALMNLTDFDPARGQALLSAAVAAQPAQESPLTLPDRWILSRLGEAARATQEALEAFRFSDAANTVYHFVWHELCDWYIELAKPQLQADGDTRALTQAVLTRVLDTSLRLLHPMTPFVTEEIWHKLPRPADAPAFLIDAPYPGDDAGIADPDAEADMQLVMGVTTGIRTLRSTYGVTPSTTVEVIVRVKDPDRRALLNRHCAIIAHAARATLAIEPSGGAVAQAAKSIVGADIEVIVPLAGLIDIDAERARIQKQLGKVEKDIAQVSRKLDNPKFVDRAPAEVVEKERARLAEEQAKKTRLAQALEALA